MPSLEGLNDIDRFVLLLLRARQKLPVPGRLFLQKEFFAICRRIPELSRELNFDSHLLGPHSDLLETESEQLELSGLVDASGGVYKLTPAGAQTSEEIARATPSPVLNAIEETKELLNDLSQDELLALIYLGSNSTDFQSESVEYARIAKSRVPLAIRLLRKGKVSPGKAAEIAGLSVDDLIQRFDKIAA